MTTAITMPNALNQALEDVAHQSMAAAARALAEKYEFPIEEAMRHLNLDELKLVKKRGPSPKSQAEKDAAKEEKKAAKKAAKKAEKAEKKSGSSSDEEKPKRPKTGYLLYSAEVRDEVKSDLTEELEEGARLLGKHVISEIARRWKELPADEVAAWNEQAKKLTEASK